MTSRCYTINDLKALTADIFMTNSNQVRAPLLDGKYDKVYFLNFASPNSREVTYAASFGKTQFSKKVIKDYRHLLSPNNAITDRESHAVKFLEDWNIECEEQVLDPPLLLDAEQWSKYITKGYYRIIKPDHAIKVSFN